MGCGLRDAELRNERSDERNLEGCGGGAARPRLRAFIVAHGRGFRRLNSDRLGLTGPQHRALPTKESFSWRVLVDEVVAFGMGPLHRQGGRRRFRLLTSVVRRPLRAAGRFGGRCRLRLGYLDLEGADRLELALVCALSLVFETLVACG